MSREVCFKKKDCYIVKNMLDFINIGKIKERIYNENVYT